MSESSTESSNELKRDITIRHGALEINFPRCVDGTFSLRTPYHCKSLSNGTQSDISPKKMSLIMAIPEKFYKTFDEINDDYVTWLKGSYNDLKINREVNKLSRSSFDVLLHKIQTEFGYDLFDHASKTRYKMREFKKK